MSLSADGGRLIETGGYPTNCHIAGEGKPLLLLHGSGPGVTALANWRGLIPPFSKSRHVIAPDLAGFGYTQRPMGLPYQFLETWTDQILNLLDTLSVEEPVDVIGNSFGGALTLALAMSAPERFGKLLLMGSAGAPLDITDDLDFAWGYEPSLENMRRALSSMAYNQSIVTDELVELRHKASLTPGFLESYAELFPAPRQRWLDALITPDDQLAKIDHPCLLIHGKHDKVVQYQSSVHLANHLPNAELVLLEDCGHWVMIEQTNAFIDQATRFFEIPNA